MTQYSPLSIAPEILEGMQFNNHNSKSDIWSIGVVLYQMLFGKYLLPYIVNLKLKVQFK